jgi:deoxycytidine triphosphate deaminase
MNRPEWPKLAAGTKDCVGVLLDREITEAMRRGQLIAQDGDAKAAKYACYELHIGRKVHQLVMDDMPGPLSDLYRVKNIPADGIFHINPDETFTIYAAEQFFMPADVFAITIPVGNMYRLGINPATSFVDPGFSGPFYLTVCNYSTRIVKLRVGDPLARVFFFRLPDRPTQIYDTDPREVPPLVARVERPDLEKLLERGEAAVIAQVMKDVDPPHYEHAFVTERMLSHHRMAIDTQLVKLRQAMNSGGTSWERTK